MNSDLKAHNSLSYPNLVTPQIVGDAVLENGFLKTHLQPASWNVIRLERSNDVRKIT